MNKQFIAEIGKYTHSRIISFSEYYQNENLLETSYSNWNMRDVIAHINRWLRFSYDKLESIKTKKPFKDIAHNKLEEFNNQNYEKDRNKKLDETVEESKIIFENYGSLLNLYNDDELLSKEFPTGFPCALWEYMALDLFIHPVNHILYHHLKTKNFETFITEIEDSRHLSNDNAAIYNFKDLFNGKEEKDQILNEVLEIVKTKENKFAEEIIKINME